MESNRTPIQSSSMRTGINHEREKAKSEQKKLNRDAQRTQKESDPLLNDALASFSLSSDSTKSPASSPAASSNSVAPNISHHNTPGGFYDTKGNFVPARPKHARSGITKRSSKATYRELQQNLRREAIALLGFLSTSEISTRLQAMRSDLGLAHVDMTGWEATQIEEQFRNMHPVWSTREKKGNGGGSAVSESSRMAREVSASVMAQKSQETEMRMIEEDTEMTL